MQCRRTRREWAATEANLGVSGPPRTPRVIAASRGFPSHRKQNPQEPQPAPATVEAPPNLTGEAKAFWDRHAPELIRIGCLTSVDRDEFAAGCLLRAMGLAGLERHRAGETPMTEREMSAMLQSSRIFARFGIGASDRTRIAVPPPKDAGKWDRLVS